MAERPEKLAAKPGKGPRIRGQFEDLRVPTFNDEPSMTDTSHGNDTDVNNIVARFARTGIMPPDHGHGQYLDVSGLQEDLTTILQRGKEALAELDELKRDAEQQAQTSENDDTQEITQPAPPPEASTPEQ